MSSDPKDANPAKAAADADVSGDMQDKLDQLDEHIDAAAKKVDAGRSAENPDPDDPVDDIAGGGTDHAAHVDDPEESPIIGPE